MASSAKFTSFLFLILTLFFSIQIHARESQFFSKVTNNKETTTVIPNKEETTTKQNQEPTFIPETQGGYGLYGHESGQFPPTTTTTTTPTHVNAAPYTATPTRLPYKNEFDDEESLNKYLNTNDDHNKNYYYNTNDDNLNNKNKNYYFNKNGYQASQYGGFGDTKLTTTERGYSTMANQNNYNTNDDNLNNKNKNYYFNKNGYQASQYGGFEDTKLTTKERGYSTMANQNNYNERQGMSDTRFMENGKYYYDINGEKYNPNQYGNSRGAVASRNWYGNKGGYYGNNANSFEHSNSMEGYQNEEEFQEEQNEFEP